MKIATYTTDSFMDTKSNNEIKTHLEAMGHQVFQFALKDHPEDAFRFRIKHFQMYYNFLNWVEEINPDIVYLENLLNVPEYLLAELKVRKNFGPKIIFIFAYRESSKSKSRVWALKELLDMPQVKFGLVESLLGDKITPPNNWLEMKPNMKKCKYMVDRVNEEPHELKRDKIESRKKYGLPLDAFTLLFFGRICFNKGLDILAEAMKQLPDVFLYIRGNGIDNDYDFDPKSMRNMPNVKLDEGWAPQDELGWIYSAADVAVIPYRKNYLYGTSGIPCQAVMADRLCIIPDLYPLSEFSKSFNLGPIFQPENVDSLVKAIRYTKDNYDILIKNAKFDTYINNLTTMKMMASYIVSEI